MTTRDGSLGLDEATLSALIDGELAPEESRRALERVARDARLRARWARYHAVRAACEGAARERLRPGFSERLRAALANEPVVVAPPAPEERSRRIRTGPVTATAIAASAAVAVIGGILAMQPRDDSVIAPSADPLAEWGPGVPQSEIAGEPATTSGAGAELEAAPQPVSLTAAVQGMDSPRMAVYMARHSEYAGAGEMPDLVPYSRLTSYNAAR